MMDRNSWLVDRQNKAFMDELLQMIETAKDMDEVREHLAAALNSAKSTDAQQDRELYLFEKEKSCEVFASDEAVYLKPLDETVREPFLSIIEGNSTNRISRKGVSTVPSIKHRAMSLWDIVGSRAPAQKSGSLP